MKKLILALITGGIMAGGVFAEPAAHIGHEGCQGYYSCLTTGYHYDFPDDFTWSCWGKEFVPSDPGGMGCLIMQGAWGDGGAAIKFNTSRSLWVDSSRVEGWAAEAVSVSWTDDDLGIFDNDWHLITITHVVNRENTARATISIYIDGILKASNEICAAGFEIAGGPSEVMSIGGKYNGNYSAGCYLADVGIWNRALSADEVLGLLKHRIDPTDNGLIGYWPFNESFADCVDNGATPHDCWVYVGSWDSCHILDSDFELPTYAEWAATQGDIPEPTIAIGQLSDVTASSVSASYQILDYGGENTSVDIYSVVTLAGYDQPITNLVASEVQKADGLAVTITGLLPARDYAVALLAENPQGGSYLSKVLPVTTPASSETFTALEGYPYVTDIEVSNVNPMGATISGSLDESGVVEEVTVQVVFADGTSAQVAVEGMTWSVSLDDLASGKEFAYDIVAMTADGKIDRVHGVPFFTYGPAAFTAECTGSAEGTNMSFTVSVEVLGLGTTTFTLLIGATADAMAPVEGVTASYSQGDTVVSFTLGCAVPWNQTYFWAVKAVSSDGAGQYEATTTAQSFNTNDSTGYTWDTSVPEGDWENPANWIADRTPNAGYPNSATAYAVICSEGVTKVHISGPKAYAVANTGTALGGQVELIGDPARNDNVLSVQYVGSLAPNTTLVLDNVSLKWWDYQPWDSSTKLVFRGENPVFDEPGGLIGVANGDINLEFNIPADGYKTIPFISQCPNNHLLFDDGGWGIAMNHDFNVTIDPTSPLFKTTGKEFHIQLAAGNVWGDMLSHVHCKAPNKGDVSFDIGNGGIWFNYYRKAGFTILVR